MVVLLVVQGANPWVWLVVLGSVIGLVWWEIQSPERDMNRAMQYLESGDYNGTIAIFSQVLRNHPNYAEGYTQRSKARYFSGDLEGAKADCDRAISLDASQTDAYLGRALILIDQGDYEQSLVDLNAGVQRVDALPETTQQGYAKIYVSRAVVRNLLGDGAGALVDSDRTLALMPDYIDAYRARGDAHRLLKNFELAIADYTYGLQQSSQWSDFEVAIVYLNRGRAYQGLGRYDEAMANYTQAMEVHSQLSDAFTYRGMMHIYRNNFEEGLKDFLHCTQIAPSWASYYNQAVIQNLIGRLDEALASLNECLTLDEAIHEAYYFRGNLHYQADNKSQAATDFQKALALESETNKRDIDPEDQHGFYQRGLARHHMGNRDQALIDLHQAAQIAQQHRDQGFYKRVMSTLNQVQNSHKF